MRLAVYRARNSSIAEIWGISSTISALRLRNLYRYMTHESLSRHQWVLQSWLFKTSQIFSSNSRQKKARTISRFLWESHSACKTFDDIARVFRLFSDEIRELEQRGITVGYRQVRALSHLWTNSSCFTTSWDVSLSVAATHDLRAQQVKKMWKKTAIYWEGVQFVFCRGDVHDLCNIHKSRFYQVATLLISWIFVEGRLQYCTPTIILCIRLELLTRYWIH